MGQDIFSFYEKMTFYFTYAPQSYTSEYSVSENTTEARIVG
jgi:hypothetical protein